MPCQPRSSEGVKKSRGRSRLGLGDPSSQPENRTATVMERSGRDFSHLLSSDSARGNRDLSLRPPLQRPELKKLREEDQQRERDPQQRRGQPPLEIISRNARRQRTAQHGRKR